MKKITAQAVAVQKGHTSVDSVTTLKTVINPDAETAAGEVEMMDLRVCGVGKSAYFEWITQYGDPIGDIFDEVDEATLERRSVEIYPGMRVKTLAGEIDMDHHGADRQTPAGTWGHITSHNHADHWNLGFPNGAWVVVTEAELRDPKQYVLDTPLTLEQHALAMQYGLTKKELTILDAWMVTLTERVAGNPDEILGIIKELKELKETAQDMLETVRHAWNHWDRLDQQDNPSLGDALERISSVNYPWETPETAPEQEAAQASS